MGFAPALRLTEILLAMALIQQSAEHLGGPRDERRLFLPRLALAVGLLTGIAGSGRRLAAWAFDSASV